MTEGLVCPMPILSVIGRDRHEDDRGRRPAVCMWPIEGARSVARWGPWASTRFESPGSRRQPRFAVDDEGARSGGHCAIVCWR